MRMLKFGSFFINVEKIVYVQQFEPEITPPHLPKTGTESGGVRVGFDYGEITLFEEEDGYEEFLAWLEAEARHGEA